MTIAGIERYVQDGATWALYNQFRFMDYQDQRIGAGGDFNVDIPAQTITFGGPKGTIDAHFEVLASFAPGPRSMLWTWAIGHETDEGRRLREWGQANGVTWLAERELPINTAAQGEELIAELRQSVHDIAAALAAITGHAPYYSAPTGHGNFILGYVYLNDFPVPSIDQTFPRLFGDACAEQPGVDHRPGAQRFAQLAKFGYQWRDGRLQMHDPRTGNSVELGFNQQGWLENIRAQLGSQQANAGHSFG